MRAGAFAGGFFAIYIPSPEAHDAPDYQAMMDMPPYDLPLPELIGHEAAQPVALAMAGHLLWMERASAGAFKLVSNVANLWENLGNGTVSGIMHMEGAEAIGPDLDALYGFHAMGLRSLGPVWSRPTIFGHGVPFAYPSSPDTGGGLTDAGKRLVAACNDLKIMLDLSHMTEKGFDDVAALSSAPLVATHSNAHAITQSSRNLTDRQLAVVKASNGMVGLNFATSFLRRDGKQSADMGWEDVLSHLDHLITHLGEDNVGLGSDFDGATIPQGIGDVAGLPALQQAMLDHQYGEALVRKLCCDNWLALLGRTWGE
jgi:membrane dipeptidase